MSDKSPILELMQNKIDDMVDDPERAAKLKERLKFMSENDPPPMPDHGTLKPLQLPINTIDSGINMFDLCAALCAAAFCQGKDPNRVKPGSIATNARAVAKNLFNEDGTPKKPNNK